MKNFLAFFQKRERSFLWAIFVLSIALRIAVVLLRFDMAAPPFSGDGVQYNKIALEFVSSGVYSDTHFPVGYPLLLALNNILFGSSFAAIRLLQIIVSSLTVILVYRILRDISENRTSPIFAASIAAFYPGLIYFCGRIMAESLFTFFAVLSIYFLIKIQKGGGLGYKIAAGVFLGLGSLFKSNLVLLTPFIIIWLIIILWPNGKQILKTAAVITGVVCLIYSIFVIMNYAGNQKIILTPTNSGSTFYGANNFLAKGDWIQIYKNPALDIPEEEKAAMTPLEISRKYTAMSFEWIRKNPWQFVLLLPQKLEKAWGFWTSNAKEIQKSSKGVRIIYHISYGLVFLLMIPGLVISRKSWRKYIVLYMFIIIYTVMSLIFYGNPRMRIYIAPVLIMFAALALEKIYLRLVLNEGEP